MRRAAYITLLASLMVIGIICVCYGQQLQLWLEDEYGARTTNFPRGRGIVLAITAPNPSNLRCDLWYPPGTTGPPSRPFIGPRDVPGGNKITRIGPNYLEEKAPSGDYLLKCYVTDKVTGGTTSHDLRFTYGQVSTTTTTRTPPPPPPPQWEIIAAAAVGTAAVILVIYAIYSRRPRAPPKPAAPPTPPPTYPPPTPPKREAYPVKPPARERPRKRPKVVGERSE